LKRFLPGILETERDRKDTSSVPINFLKIQTPSDMNQELIELSPTNIEKGNNELEEIFGGLFTFNKTVDNDDKLKKSYESNDSCNIETSDMMEDSKATLRGHNVRRQLGPRFR